MGTWGTGIFDDDVAVDVRHEFLDAVANGEDDAAVTKRMIKAWAGVDDDETPIFWLALASTQWEYGRLRDRVKQQALAVIKRGDARFGDDDKPRRQRALAKLAAQLTSKQPKQKTPRRRKQIDTHSRSVVSPDGSATATAFAIGTLGQVMVSMISRGTEGGGGVFAADCRAEDLELRFIDDATLEISHPSGIRVQDRDDDTFYDGRRIAIVYRVRRGKRAGGALSSPRRRRARTRAAATTTRSRRG